MVYFGDRGELNKMANVKRRGKNIKKKLYKAVMLKRKGARYREMYLETRELSNKIAKRTAEKVDEHFKKIMFDTENEIKEHVPSKHVMEAFKYVESVLYKNGIAYTFNIQEDSMQPLKIDNTDFNDVDIHAVCNKIVNKAVKEIENVLSTADNVIHSMSEKHCPMKKTGVVIMKRKLEEELLDCGLECEF